MILSDNYRVREVFSVFLGINWFSGKMVDGVVKFKLLIIRDGINMYMIFRVFMFRGIKRGSLFCFFGDRLWVRGFGFRAVSLRFGSG